MTTNELVSYLENLKGNIRQGVPDMVAETATEYYKEAFEKKGFDGTQWATAKPKKTGSLLIESGNMANSIRPAIVSDDLVVIQAGNDKVDYAQAHNEGFSGVVNIPAHTRTNKHGTHTVEAHTRTMNITQRQFMGYAAELMQRIKNRIDGHVKYVTGKQST